MRGPSSMVGHLQPMIRPKVSDKFDYEAELAFVVGKRAKHLTAANALDCLAGYSVFNDGSLRDYQRSVLQMGYGFSRDSMVRLCKMPTPKTFCGASLKHSC